MRWIVDGMNVIGSRPDGWWRDRNRAMATLVERLERWADAEGYDVTVVFERPPSPPIESSVITVAHAPEAAANSADDEIVRLVHADADPAAIHVATSDRALSERSWPQAHRSTRQSGSATSSIPVAERSPVAPSITAADIRSEMDARRIVHTLGITQLRGPYSWDVVDNQGRLFVAEIRHRPEVVADDCRARSA